MIIWHPRKQCESETAKGEKRVSRLIPSLADFQVHVFQHAMLRSGSSPKGKEWSGEPWGSWNLLAPKRAPSILSSATFKERKKDLEG